MKDKFTAIIAAILTIGMAAFSTGVRADVVIDWNNAVLDAVRATSTNPPRATRAFAMMHTAVYDAINGAIGQPYKPYYVSRTAPKGASPEAAAAAAAHTVLVDLYPTQQDVLDALLADSLAAVPDGPAKNKAVAWGRYCGKKILKLRKRDGSDAVVVYMPSGLFGRWQPTPPDFAPALLPQWPYVTPFAMWSGSQFRVGPPPAFESDAYASAYNEVKVLGDIDSTTRTADETEIAYFWEDGPGTVTPPGHWQVIAQDFAQSFGNSLIENARLFALLSITQADAAIVAWDNKYYYDHVRPYTAITMEAEDDGNPDTAADRAWFNLLPTPPFPTYTSGHSTFSSSSARLLKLFYGSDDISFCGVAPDPQRWPGVLPGVERCWDTLWQAAEEAGQSRIYGGIHWQYDNQGGLRSGRALANFVYRNYLKPRFNHLSKDDKPKGGKER
jgi:hypothetical protein